jgi:hypothetical protein
LRTFVVESDVSRETNMQSQGLDDCSQQYKGSDQRVHCWII